MSKARASAKQTAQKSPKRKAKSAKPAAVTSQVGETTETFRANAPSSAPAAPAAGDPSSPVDRARLAREERQRARHARRVAFYSREETDRRVQVRFDDRLRREFLAALEAHGSMIGACDAVGVSKATAHRHRKDDEAFDAECVEALDRHRQAVAEEVRERAVDGWEEPVFHQGVMVGTVRRKSDRMLELYAKRVDPAFRDKVHVEQSGSLEVRHTSAGARARIEELLGRARELAGGGAAAAASDLDDREPHAADGSGEDG